MAGPLGIVEDGLVGRLHLRCRMVVFTGVQVTRAVGKITEGHSDPNTVAQLEYLTGGPQGDFVLAHLVRFDQGWLCQRITVSCTQDVFRNPHRTTVRVHIGQTHNPIGVWSRCLGVWGPFMQNQVISFKLINEFSKMDQKNALICS